jgi:hypothetical protein
MLVAQGGVSYMSEPPWLVADTLEYLIELSGTRVELQSLTHGVVITDALPETPRLSVSYPSGLRAAKRSPLLFDSRRSVLIVNRAGRARNQLQRHRLERLLPSPKGLGIDDNAFVDSGSLVALATRRLGGIGVLPPRGPQYLDLRRRPAPGDPPRRALDGVSGLARHRHRRCHRRWPHSGPRRTSGAHDLDATQRSYLRDRRRHLCARRHVETKDRYDLRDQFDPPAMRPETRLHHLIDATDMDAHTLARLGGSMAPPSWTATGSYSPTASSLSSADSQHEGARTAATRSLSRRLLAVLKVSEDGEITVFREGDVVATLLRSGSATRSS